MKNKKSFPNLVSNFFKLTGTLVTYEIVLVQFYDKDIKAGNFTGCVTYFLLCFVYFLKLHAYFQAIGDVWSIYQAYTFWTRNYC